METTEWARLGVAAMLSRCLRAVSIETARLELERRQPSLPTALTKCGKNLRTVSTPGFGSPPWSRIA